MACDDISYDNRATCVNLLPSSCIPYVGVVPDSIKEDIPCHPNANDIFKNLLERLDVVIAGLGDNKTLDKDCTTIVPATDSQKDINQKFITELCAIKTILDGIDGGIDPTTINLAVDLLCLEDPSCDPQATYTLPIIINKLVIAYCSLLTRVAAIEATLNI